MTMKLRDSLKQSAVNRHKMKKLLGFIPFSILKLSRGKLSKSLFTFQHERKNRKLINRENSIAAKNTNNQLERISNLKKEFGNIAVAPYAGSINRHEISIMPGELVDFFCKYYTRPGMVYIDPFMGQGVRLQVAKLCGLDYYGYDVSNEFYQYITRIKNRIDNGKTKINTTLGDSRYPNNIPDNIGDFSFHSPPYWNIEYYGDETEQLGNGTYNEFLDGMYLIYKNWLPKFKSGAYNVININDFRRNKRFYAYHVDLINIAIKAGWILHDIWIIDGLIGGLPKAFAVDFNIKKIAPKIHEYAIVLRKP